MQKTVFMCAKLRSDVENITYVTVFNFLIQELEVNIELNYLLSLLDFGEDITKALGSAMTTPHPVFGKKMIEETQAQGIGMSRIEMARLKAESEFKPITNWASL